MKMILVGILTLTSLLAFSQSWNLGRVNNNSEYPFEYWFSFNTIDDSSSFQVHRAQNNGESQLKGITKGTFGDTLSFVKVQITNLSSDSISTIQSDSSGRFSIYLSPGKFSLEATHLGTKNLRFEFDIKKSETLFIDLNIQGTGEDEVYQINSKQRLTDKVIIELMDCVKANGVEFSKACSKMDSYFILMQI